MKKRFISICLGAAMLLSLTACNEKKKTEEVPELLETTVTNESYRTVERGNVGDVVTIPARAVPRSYGQFYEKALAISEIYVDIGDHVEKGDKLASADTEDIDNQLKNLNKQKEDLEDQIEEVKDCSWLKREKLGYEKKACEELGDTEGANAKEKEIETEIENADYSVRSLEKSLESVKDDIDKALAEREKMILYASHSGYVTYKMNMVEGNVRNSYENVVMISDYDDVYIEADGVSLQKFGKYRSADRMETIYNGKTYTVTEDVYSSSANSYASATEKYPRVRFKVEGTEIKLGDVIPIFVYMYYHENVLRVGNDSIRNDGNSKYVFVETEEGGMEKRTVEVGYSDSIYTEILSGLEEGENVYYLSDSMKPSKYSEITVGRSDYVQCNYTNIYEYLSTNADVYSTPESGTFMDYAVAGNKYVESGEPLFSVKVKISEAQLLEQKQIIEQTRKQHEASVKDYNERLEQLDREISEAENAPVPAATDTDALRDSKYKKEKLQIEKELIEIEAANEEKSYENTIEELEKDYNKYRNIADNDDILTVYSKRAGIVRLADMNQYGYWEYELNAAMSLLSIEYGDEDKLLVKAQPSAASSDENNYTKKKYLPRPGTKIYLTDDSKVYTGICTANIGDNPDDKIYYMEEWDGHTYITTCPANIYHNIGTGYFISLDDEATPVKDKQMTVYYEVMNVKNAVVIPTDAIYSEKRAGSNNFNYYVWLKKDDNFVKQYVVYNPDYSGLGDSLILEGLEEGDIIALENKEVER